MVKDGVVPSIWPNLPEHLTPSPVSPRPTEHASADARKIRVEEARKAQVQEEKLKDEFLSLEELLEKFDLSRLPSEVMFVPKNEAILFFKISPSRDPQILYALQIENSLDFSCWFEGERVNSKTTSPKISS